MRAPVPRLVGLLAAVVLLGGPAGPAGADRDSHRLVVEGSRSAHVPLHVPVPGMDLRSVTVAGGGTHVAVVIVPRAGGPGPGTGVLRSESLGGGDLLFGVRRLEPGNYRLHLLTTRSTRVTFELSSPVGAATLRPRKPVSSTASFAERPLTAGADPSQVRLAAAVGPDRYALLALRVVGGTRLESQYLCAAAKGRSCPAPTDFVPGPDDPAPALHSPNTVNQEALVLAAPPDSARRDAVMGVEGVRTQAGRLRSLVLSFTSD